MKPKKLLSFILAAIMLISLLPTFTLTAFADNAMYNGNYGNFEDMLDLAQEAENGGLVKLLEDIYLAEDITIEKGNVALELNTRRLDGNFTINVKKGATLTILTYGVVGYQDYDGTSIINEGKLNISEASVRIPIVNKGTMEMAWATVSNKVSTIGGSILTVKNKCTIDTLYIEKTNDGTPSISLGDSALKYIKSVSNPTTLAPLTLSEMLANGYGVKYQENWVDGTLTELGVENSANCDISVDKLPTLAAGDFTFTAPSDLTYDGKAKAATVTSSKVETDDIKVKYYDASGNQLTSEPTEVRTYTVKIDVDEGDNYAEAKDLTADDWKFKIVKAEKNIILGKSALSGYDSENGYKFVYYGTYSDNPIKWHIFSMNGNEGTYKDGGGNTVDSSNAMFLHSYNSLRGGSYNSSKKK